MTRDSVLWGTLVCVLLVGVHSTTELKKMETDVCTSPFPAMPAMFKNDTHTSWNGMECYECEIANATEISDKTCNVTNCTGTGSLGPACYRWEFTYKGFKRNTIRTGCGVNCSWVDYEKHMCSGVGENVFDACVFVMCNSSSKCNHGYRTTTVNALLLALTLLSYLIVKI